MAKRPSSDGATLRSAISALTQRLRREDGPSDIGPTGLGLLGLLYRDGPMSASQLAALTFAQPQSLTRPLQALEDARLINRSEDKADRRRAILAITTKGQELFRKSLSKRIGWLNSALARLTDDERETLRRAARLIEHLARDEEHTMTVSDDVFNIIPFTHVANVERSVEFYSKLGFEVDGSKKHGNSLGFASMHSRVMRAGRIMFSKTCDTIDPRKQQVLFYCWTDGLVSLHARLNNDGLAPGAIEYDERGLGEFALTDPDGYCIMVAEVRHIRPRPDATSSAETR